MTEKYPLIKKWLGLEAIQWPSRNEKCFWVRSSDLENKLANSLATNGLNIDRMSMLTDAADQYICLKAAKLDPRAQEIESIKNEIKNLNDKINKLGEVK